MVFVLSNTNKKLMPTNEYRARKLLKSGKATIYKYRPFEKNYKEYLNKVENNFFEAALVNSYYNFINYCVANNWIKG